MTSTRHLPAEKTWPTKGYYVYIDWNEGGGSGEYRSVEHMDERFAKALTVAALRAAESLNAIEDGKQP